MGVRAGHSPMFPAYQYTRNRKREIAMLYRDRQGTWILQGRRIQHTCDSTSDVCEFLRSVASEQRYDVYITSFDKEYCPFFEELMNKEWCYSPLTVNNATGIHVTGFRFRASNNMNRVRVLNLVPISKWNLGTINSVSAMPYILLLTKLFKLMKCGVQVTPGGQGIAYMHQQWTKLGYKPISNAPRSLQLLLEKYQIGGRVDTPGIGRKYQEGYEYDLCSAYPTVACSLPHGPITYYGTFEPIADDNMAVYFAECRITVLDELLISPVGIWDEKRKSHQWRLEAGDHVTGLWSGEILALRECGVHVVILRCYAWMEIWAGLTPLMQQYESWIACAEEKRDMEIVLLLKLVRLAGLGRWGMRPEKAIVITEEKANDTDIPFLPSRHESGPPHNIYYLRTSYDKRRFYGIHLWCYMQTAVRLLLWDRTILEMQLGNTIIATNFDSYTVTERSQLSYVVARHGGQWKEKRLSPLYIPYPRAVASPQKVRLPGTPFEARQEILQWLSEVENELQKSVSGIAGG